MALLDLLNKRYKAAKSFTEKHQKEVVKCIEDYKCEKTEDTGVYNKHLKADRYDFVIPYIFSTHESMLASVFEKGVELVISDKGAQDEMKALGIKATYEYLRDKLDLDTFYTTSAWWYLLVGFVSSHEYYDVEIKGQAPVLMDDGTPMLDELGMPITTPIYEWNDPRVEVDDPAKVYFSPDSEFSINAEKVTGIVREKLMTKDEVVEMYGATDVEATDRLETGSKADEKDDDLQRVSVRYYCMEVPREFAAEIENYDEEQEYYITATASKILNVAVNDKKTTLARWFAPPTDFFGFGLGKTLRSSQREMSLRRQQQMRYGDLYAFPWLAVDASTKVDQRSLNDVTRRTPLVYTERPPQFLVPPPPPQVLSDLDNLSRSDAQFISGTLDLSKGAQESNTVKTATGQQLFAQSQDKRINKIRIELGAYYRQVVINLMKLARDNWDDEKILKVAGDEGEVQEIPITKELMESIDFDTDIDIQLDTISVNKDTAAQRVIELYDKVKDDPQVDRKKVFNKMLKEGFQIKSPESYSLQPGQEGTQPTAEPMNTAEALPGAQDQLLGNEMAPTPSDTPYV